MEMATTRDGCHVLTEERTHTYSRTDMRWNPFKKEKDPFAHDMSGLLRSSYKPKRKKPWVLRHRWVAGSLVVLLLLMGGGAYGLYRYFHLQGQIQDESIGGVTPTDDALDPFNILLVGSDSREGLTEEEQLDLGADAVGGERADTLILAHVDPETNHITMVQFPRDLYVPIPGNGSNKINSALMGGKTLLVKTVEELTGLQINKYAQVNLAGFRDVVDAIGGVKLCITEPIPFDPQTGIEVTQEEIDEDPMIHFDGDKALRFVRSRAFATSDFQRIQNQQRFLAAAIDKVTSLGTLFSPTRIDRLLRAAGENIRVDRSTTPKGLLDISRKFRNFNPENYEAYTAPNFGIGNINGASVVLPDMETMKIMFAQIAMNRSPLDAPGLISPDINVAEINIGVYNGTFEDGVATEAAEQLKEATRVTAGSVDVVDISNADKINYKRTIVRYDPDVEGAEEKAKLIAQAVPNATLEEGETNFGVDVALIVGKEGVEFTKLVQIVPMEIPEPSEVPPACR